MAEDGVASTAVETVIVALDGSAASERALPVGEWLGQRLDAGVRVVSAVRTEGDETAVAFELAPIAVRWARLLGMALTIVTVAEPVPQSVRGGYEGRGFGPDGDVVAYLDALVKCEHDQGVPIELVVEWDPIGPAEGIADYLAGHDVGLVAVMSHGRVGFERLAFGSVATTVVHG